MVQESLNPFGACPHQALGYSKRFQTLMHLEFFFQTAFLYHSVFA
jgi:hypothetical protein